MNLETVESKLIEVLREIQSDSGLDGQSIEKTTCPINDLEGFDSLLWPVAISMLADALKKEIPLGTNVFFSEKDQRPLTIYESAKLVCEILSKKEN